MKRGSSNYDELVKVVIPVLNAPTVGEGGNPGARNFLKRMDSRLRTSGMTAMKRTFCDVVKYDFTNNCRRC